MSLHENDVAADGSAEDAFFAGPATSRCAQHPEADATFTCARCGDYGCGACEAVQPEGFCVRCAAIVVRETAASYWSVAALVLGFFGVGCAPIGWLGMLLGGVDLTLGLMGRAGTGGRLLSAIGIGLGLVGTVLWLYAIFLAATDPAAYPADYPPEYY